MEENTLQTIIDYIKDLTGQTDASDAKIVRAINFTVDEYSRIRITGSGKWKRGFSNHGDLSTVTTTLSGNKLSLESEMIAIERVDIQDSGKYRNVLPTDLKDHDEPLDAIYETSALPKYYDYDHHHLYFYPGSDTSRTVRVHYKRAHPRFTTSNLTASLGIIPIDEEFLAIGASARLTIGSNDPSHVSIRSMYEGMKADIKDSQSKEDQNTPRKLKGNIPSVFKRK